MKQHLIRFWEVLKTSFWFIPLLLILSGTILSFALVFLDNQVSFHPPGFLDFFYSSEVEGARSVLSTIAGSMMTVAGIVFSTTIVALTLASSQFGPRLLRNFMSDRLNQVVLGTYVATFIYCLLVLKSVRAGSTTEFVPNFSIFFAMILAVINILLLIVFIHHIATAIQADTVISKVANELKFDIHRLFPDELEAGSGFEGEALNDKKKEMARHPVSVNLPAPESGYVQSIDTDKLMRLATDHDLLLTLPYRPGQFVLKDAQLLLVKSTKPPDQTLIDQLLHCFSTGEFRTPIQDAEFAVRQLVEVACRALSPGINDPYTAITCIDKLGATIASLLGRAFPPTYWYDDHKRLRVIANATDFAGLVDVSFNQIRQFGSNSPAVLIRMMEILSALAKLARNKEQNETIRRHAAMVNRAGQEALSEPNDRTDLEERFAKITKTLNLKN
jgi:uncharacterized membrane protein